MFYPQNDPLTEEPPHFTDTETEALRGEIKLVQKGKIEKGRQKGRERKKKKRRRREMKEERRRKMRRERGEKGGSLLLIIFQRALAYSRL